MAVIDFFDSKECQWSDVKLFIEGVETVKFTRVRYGVKPTKTHLHAGGDDPISIQSGNREPSGSITLLKGAFDAVMKAAIVAGGRDVTDLVFDIQIHYKGRGSRIPQTDMLIGCEIESFEKAISQGDAKMEVELPFKFLRLKPV